MAANGIMQASETGLAAVAGSVAKAHQAWPDNVRDAADRKLGAESNLGKGVLSVVDTIAEEAAKARSAGSAAAAEIAAVREMDTEELSEKVAAISDAAKKKVSKLQVPGRAKKRRMPGTKVVLGTIVLAAAAGGAVLAWRRKAAADARVAEDDQSGITPTEDSMLAEQGDDELAQSADDLGTPTGEPLDLDLGDVPTEVAQAPEPFGVDAAAKQDEAQDKPES